MIKPKSNLAGNWEVGVSAHVACPKLVPLRLVIANEYNKFLGQDTVPPRLWKNQREQFEAEVECEWENKRKWDGEQRNRF